MFLPVVKNIHHRDVDVDQLIGILTGGDGLQGQVAT